MPIRVRLSFQPSGTANRVAVFSPTGLLTSSVVTTTELEKLSGLSGDILTTTSASTVSNKTFDQDLVADTDNQHDIGSSGVKWKDAYLAGQVSAGSVSTTGDVVVGGNLTVQGTTTTVNSATLEVTDSNILINNGGSDATSEGAGLTIERSVTNGALIYADASATKFRAGPAGSEVDLVGTTSTQTLTNKTLVAASNTITTAASGNLAATELNAALAELQDDIDSRQSADDTLTALAALDSNTGLLAQTGADTFTKRSLAAGSTKITVTNPNGVSGNPTIDVDQTQIDHGSIGGLSDDDHAQYALLNGRNNSQTLNGGSGSGGTQRLYLISSSSLSNAGLVMLGSASESAAASVDDSGRLAIRTATGRTTNTDTAIEVGGLNDEYAIRLPRNEDAAESGITGVSGHIYYNETSGAPKWHNGTSWSTVASTASVSANTTAINNHIGDTTDAHDASAISVVASGNLAATDVQAALDELQTDIDNRQPLDAELSALAGLTSAADKLPYFTGSGTAALADVTSTARSLLDDTSVGAMRTTLELDPSTSAISASEIDWSTLKAGGGLYTKTLSANTTFTFANAVAGQTIVVRLTNTASNYTVTWPTVKWAGGVAPTMTTGAKDDIYTFIYDGTSYYGSAVQDFS